MNEYRCWPAREWLTAKDSAKMLYGLDAAARGDVANDLLAAHVPVKLFDWSGYPERADVGVACLRHFNAVMGNSICLTIGSQCVSVAKASMVCCWPARDSSHSTDSATVPAA